MLPLTAALGLERIGLWLVDGRGFYIATVVLSRGDSKVAAQKTRTVYGSAVIS